MTYTYKPKGVCSRQMEVEIENGIIQKVNIIGGCSGNLQGISRLVTGMPVAEAIARMKGIQCGFKSSSCPVQLAIALSEALQQAGN